MIINGLLINSAAAPSTTHTVKWYDYDGTLLKTEQVADGTAATPPEEPSHSGLTFECWNQTYSNITRNELIGANYTTTDGKTKVVIRLTNLTDMLLSVNVEKSDTSELTVDWGDSSTSTNSGSGNQAIGPHTYAAAGDYTITMWISSGSGTYKLGTTTTPLIYYSSALTSYCTLELYIGDDVTGINSVVGAKSLEVISCPSTVVSIGNISNSYNLKGFVIPSECTSIGTAAFSNCTLIKYLTLPSGLTSIEENVFSNCSNLSETLYVPSGITTLGANAFYGCSRLEAIEFGSTITSIGISTFQKCSSLKELELSAITDIPSSAFRDCTSLLSIGTPTIATANTSSCNGCSVLTGFNYPTTSVGGTYAFSGCYSLFDTVTLSGTAVNRANMYYCYSAKTVTIPSAITSIDRDAFGFCYGITEYILEGTTPPSLLYTTALSGISPLCKIYVPDANVDDYKTATNWVTYAKYIYPVSERPS